MCTMHMLLHFPERFFKTDKKILFQLADSARGKIFHLHFSFLSRLTRERAAIFLQFSRLDRNFRLMSKKVERKNRVCCENNFFIEKVFHFFLNMGGGKFW